MVREMLEEQIVPEGKDNRCGCGSGTPLGFRLGKKELRLGRIKGEGEREDAEGGSILAPTARASAALRGSSGSLLLCQISAAAEPCSVLASVLIMGRRNPKPRGEEWGKRQCPC